MEQTNLSRQEGPQWCAQVCGNKGHCQSLLALLFRMLRTVADIRTEDAKYHDSNLGTNWTKEVALVFVWQAEALWDACCSMLLFCVTGARF